MDANRAEPAAADGNNAAEEERNALAKDQLEFIFELAVKFEEFFRLQVMYGKALEAVKDDTPPERGGYVTRFKLLTTLLAKLERGNDSVGVRDNLISPGDLGELHKKMREAQPFPYPANFLTERNRSIMIDPLSHEHFDYQHGFCTGALSMSRLIRELSGPMAAAPMTRQRLKRAVYSFPSFSVCPSRKLDKNERAASVLPTPNRQVEFFERALGGHLPELLQTRVPPGYEENEWLPRLQNATGSFVTFFDDDLLVHIGTFLHPSDLANLAITSKRFREKSDAFGRSIVEEAALVAIRNTHPEIAISYSLSSGETWVDIYNILIRNDYLRTKLQFMKNYLDTSYFEILYCGAGSDDKISKVYKDEFESMKVGRWYVSAWQYGVYAAWRSVGWLFRDLSEIKVPNENPLGLTEDDEYFDEQYDHPDYAPSIENQRDQAFDEFPFLDR